MVEAASIYLVDLDRFPTPTPPWSFTFQTPHCINTTNLTGSRERLWPEPQKLSDISACSLIDL